MARMFGTDGVRGVANTELTCELALKLGRAAAYVLAKQSHKKARIAIGMDTRISGDMLQSALVAGICSTGADALILGVVPTPAVAYLVKKYGADAGAVISASHNPAQFNGIKFFSREGFKLPDATEDEIEALVNSPENAELAAGDSVGRIITCDTACEDYASHVAECVGEKLDGIKIGVDCANGAASRTARLIFGKLGANCVFTGDEPDGVNINRGVGSTHLENLAKLIKKNKLDIGVAFDGDADRCLVVDENGEELDGDKIIAILAMEMKANGELPQDTAVVTVMSNLGFMDYCKQNGINAVCTAVGDRYVLEEMLRCGYAIGGEQSGHVILLKHATTGDGELTAAMLLRTFKRAYKRASEMTAQVQKYPQTLVNVSATAEQKAAYRDDEELAGFIESKQQQLFSQGRVLVRVSGTEPVIRVMLEGKDLEQIKETAQEIAEKIKERIIL